MGYKTKVQLIKRVKSQQFYVCFPSALAQAMEFEPSEVVEWVIESDGKLVLKRTKDTDGVKQQSAPRKRGKGGRR